MGSEVWALGLSRVYKGYIRSPGCLGYIRGIEEVPFKGPILRDHVNTLRFWGSCGHQGRAARVVRPSMREMHGPRTRQETLGNPTVSALRIHVPARVRV